MPKEKGTAGGSNAERPNGTGEAARKNVYEWICRKARRYWFLLPFWVLLGMVVGAVDGVITVLRWLPSFRQPRSDGDPSVAIGWAAAGLPLVILMGAVVAIPVGAVRGMFAGCGITFSPKGTAVLAGLVIGAFFALFEEPEDPAAIRMLFGMLYCLIGAVCGWLFFHIPRLFGRLFNRLSAQSAVMLTGFLCAEGYALVAIGFKGLPRSRADWTSALTMILVCGLGGVAAAWLLFRIQRLFQRLFGRGKAERQ